MAVRVRTVVAMSRFPPEPRLVTMLEAECLAAGLAVERMPEAGLWRLFAHPPRPRLARRGSRTWRWLSCCTRGWTRQAAPQTGVRSHEDDLRAGGEEPVHELLGQPTIDSDAPRGASSRPSARG